ncbi:hypothetical protein CSPAE12_00108 [Colletotrichum incanum]|nr:hypothetical protein CSPAE12_00108 [Colletotrichum incanum]
MAAPRRAPADSAIGPLQPQTLEPNKAPLQPLSLCSDVFSFFHIQSHFFLCFFQSFQTTNGSSNGHSNVTAAQSLILPCFPCFAHLPSHVRTAGHQRPNSDSSLEQSCCSSRAGDLGENHGPLSSCVPSCRGPALVLLDSS